MPKQSFKQKVNEMLVAKFSELGWRRYKHTFTKILPSGLMLTISAFPKDPGHIHGVHYSPVCFVSDIGIECLFEQFTREVGTVMFPKSIGTFVVPLSWVIMGASDIFTVAVPVYPNCSPTFASEVVDRPAVFELCNRIATDYLVTKGKVPNIRQWMENSRSRWPLPVPSYPDSTDDEIATHLDRLVADAEESFKWFSECFAEELEIVELAENAEDISTCSLFGPIWPYKIPFILLANGLPEQAKSFRHFLQDIRWSQAFMIDEIASERKMDEMFAWFESRTACDSASCASDKFSDTIKDRICSLTVTDRKSSKRARKLGVISIMVFSSDIVLPGLYEEMDMDLYGRILLLNNLC